MLHKPKLIMSLVALLGVLAGTAASAAESAEKIADAARCYACHQMTTASLGPPWQAIAARHAPNKKLMVDVLARKIVRGGGGNWGDVPMVPNQLVSIDEARVIAGWILDLQPKK